jgi:hypothetical protein
MKQSGAAADEGRVVMAEATAEWLHTVFGLPGFGAADAEHLLNKTGERETEGSAPIETYVELAARLADPVPFTEYLGWLSTASPTAVAGGGKALSQLRRDAMRVVLRAVSRGNIAGLAFHADIRSAAGGSAAQWDKFVELFVNDVRVESVDDGNTIVRVKRTLRTLCEQEFVCVDLAAFEPIFSGEALRFDILPAIVHAAGWCMAPGADVCPEWCGRSFVRARRSDDGRIPPAQHGHSIIAPPFSHRLLGASRVADRAAVREALTDSRHARRHAARHFQVQKGLPAGRPAQTAGQERAAQLPPGLWVRGFGGPGQAARLGAQPVRAEAVAAPHSAHVRGGGRDEDGVHLVGHAVRAQPVQQRNHDAAGEQLA